jgi:hypothetical protein
LAPLSLLQEQPANLASNPPGGTVFPYNFGWLAGDLTPFATSLSFPVEVNHHPLDRSLEYLNRFPAKLEIAFKNRPLSLSLSSLNRNSCSFAATGGCVSSA